MLEFDLNGVEHKEYVSFPVGKNKCWVNRIIKKAPQAGKPYIELKMTDGNATITDRLYLTDTAKWRIQQFLKACQLPHKGTVKVDEKDIEGRHLIIECVAEAYKKQDGTEGTAIKVKNYLQDTEFSYGSEEQPKEELTLDDIPY